MKGRTGSGHAFFAAALLLAGATFAGNAPASFAFSFEPMSTAFEASGPLSIRSFRLENDGKERISVRVSILTRKSAEDGSETNEPVSDSFLVFPSRFVIESGGTRSLKVQWRGGDPG